MAVDAANEIASAVIAMPIVRRCDCRDKAAETIGASRPEMGLTIIRRSTLLRPMIRPARRSVSNAVPVMNSAGDMNAL